MSEGLRAGALREPGTLDRARGGQLKVKLTIPAAKYDVKPVGSVFIPEKVVEFVLDLERMPLVNVSGYAVDRVQIQPDTIAYPNGDASVDAKFKG